MWNPLEGWAQQGSFVEPVPPPDLDPDVPPLVCVQFSAAWLPYVLGSLLQLMQPSTWDADAAGIALAQARATDLIRLVGNGCGCVDLRMRLQSCELQFSVDGGVTYQTVAGWDGGMHDCVLGWIPPPAPVNVLPVTNDQRACNIAGWLAHEFIRVSIQTADTYIQNNDTILHLFNAIVSAFVPMSTFVNAALAGVNALFTGITNANLNQFIAAVNDPAFWSALTCVIYTDIRTPGYLTAANFPTVVNDIAAMAYAQPAVPPLLAAYINDLGFPLVEQLTAVGAIDQVDCSGCGTWCFEWDFRLGLEHWQFEAGSCGAQLCGFGLCGCHENIGTPNEQVGVNIFRDFSPPVSITAVCMWARANTNANGATRVFQGSLAGNVVFHGDLDPNFQNYPQGAEICQPGLAVTIDRLFVAWRVAGAPPNTADIQSIKIEGTGPNPLGTNNCTY